MNKKYLYYLLVSILSITTILLNLPILTAIYYGFKNNILPINNIIIFVILLSILIGTIIFTLLKKSKKTAVIYSFCLIAILLIFSNQFKLSSNQNINYKLPQEILSIIANNTIDIYPTDINYVKTNNLNWTPRPFPFININTLETDRQNAAFFENKKAPLYLLINKNNNKNLLINNQPITFYQIINNYKIENENETFAILKQTKKPLYPIRKIYPSPNIKFGEWLKAPIEFNKIFLLQLNPIKTTLGNILNIIPAQTDIFIEYKFQNNEIKKYKLPSSYILKQGILINPYSEHIYMPKKTKIIKEFRILARNKNCYVKTIPAQWTAIKRIK